MRDAISVCLIVKNEAQLLAGCLASVRPIADEIVLVDTGSTDATLAVAHRFGARVIHHKWTGHYARARNVYLRAARGQWILVIDGDESIAAADLPVIERLVRSGTVAGYRLLVRNYTDDYDLLWQWSPNDEVYRREERQSACEGWMKTEALRLFRNVAGVTYGDGHSAHPTTRASLETHGAIRNRADVVIHHFQCLKGGAPFLATKQRSRLTSELKHITHAPGDELPYLNAAKTLFSERRDRAAARCLSTLLRLDPGHHDAHHLSAIMAFEQGRLSVAERHARLAIAARAKSADAWCMLGMAMTEDGRLAEAVGALARAIRLHPGHLMAHNSLGVAYEDLGRYRDAARQFRTALKLHRRFAPAQANLARVMARKS